VIAAPVFAPHNRYCPSRKVSRMQVILANPRGFCAGVDRAIEIVEQALSRFGAPIYVRHEIVHNRFVVEGLRAKGAIFVDELDQVPDGATVVFSAHGVAQDVHEEGRRRGLTVFDATCHPDRPRRPSRGRGHHGPGARRHVPGGGRGRRRRARSPRS
jgi:hypothetical protein